MDIGVVAKKIRQAVMDSAEDQGRTFNASILDEVIAKELRLHMPSSVAPSNYPWTVVPFGTEGGNIHHAKWSDSEIKTLSVREQRTLTINKIGSTDEWR